VSFDKTSRTVFRLVLQKNSINNARFLLCNNVMMINFKSDIYLYVNFLLGTWRCIVPLRLVGNLFSLRACISLIVPIVWWNFILSPKTFKEFNGLQDHRLLSIFFFSYTWKSVNDSQRFYVKKKGYNLQQIKE